MEILNLVHVVVIFATFLCTENNSWLESHEIDKFGEHPDNRDSTLVHAKKKFYGYWSQCSTSCGSGYQRWICISGMDECRSNETRPCFIKFCPSYLSFPRMHFYGQFTADVNTINNVRCNYVNKRFTAPNIKEDIEILTRKDGGYETGTTNWNPDGSGRFHIDAKVTALVRENVEYSTNDSIIGSEIKETSPVAIVDLDPDWQLASEIYGLQLKIQGVLEAKVKTSAIQQPKPRGDYVMATMKSVLIDVKWLNKDIKNMFKNSTKLSISFLMDQFEMKSLTGRVTGTIGMTSDDDPLATTALRRMYPESSWPMKGSLPFYIDQQNKIMSIDLSTAFNCTTNGEFNIVEIIGSLDLVMNLDKRNLYRSRDCREGTKETVHYITQDGAISESMKKNDEWYSLFGGIVNIDLKRVPDEAIALMMSHELAIVRTMHGMKNPQIIFSETEGGITIGFMGKHVSRLNPGETHEASVFVSSFGKPLDGVDVIMDVARNSIADTDCGWNICSNANGQPRNAAQFSHTPSKKRPGLYEFKITAFDPGNPRGCGLDGQIYPIEIILRYNNKTYIDGGLMRQEKTTEKYYDYYLATIPSVIAIYAEVETIQCPTWTDIKDIFLLYHNLYPIMWKNDIIDLSSYADVKKRNRMLKYAMFETDFDDPRYMPISRDLSKGKAKLIKNWMECGMIETDNPVLPTCDYEEIKKRQKQVKQLVQRAITLELTTIPPYYTAWLSLQTEFGRNREAADILKSVFVDEMLHMSLAANILNAIDGTVNLSTYSNLPQYPTTLEFGESYKIAPNLIITLGPMTKGLINDVFLTIEAPADEHQKKILENVIRVLEMLPPNPSSSIFSKFVSDHSYKIPDNETERDCLGHGAYVTTDWEKIKNFSSNAIYSISKTDISSIGAFYTLIALNLAFLESCYQTENYDSETIFTGNQSYQIEATHWHRPEMTDDMNNESPIFGVYDLKSALHAIIAIIHDGEGGTSCAPHLSNSSDILPHYYRFMEIAYGNKLMKLRKSNALGLYPCIKIDGCVNETEYEFCFSGEPVSFSQDGVWPLIFNPGENIYQKNSDAYRLNKNFNHLYTRLLKCLETTFSGSPDYVTNCMQEMHYMRIIGKKLVQTPVYKNKLKLGTGTPTWTYQRDKSDTTGLPLIQNFETLY